MKDPYEVLGISKNASADEIRSAYRELAKKYHPDNYSDNPLSDLASEKMREINEAYEFIMNQKKQGDDGGYQSQQRSWRQSGAAAHSDFPNIRELILKGRLSTAQQMLNAVPESSKNAEWFFLRGVIMCREGWLDQGFTDIQRAHNMDPSNSEYYSSLQQLQNQRSGNFPQYQTMNPSMAPSCGICDICSLIMCADCCCNSHGF
ncbi:MAG: J domain-containing protein [Oscillospiraceae bacterium]|jgi:curved DNA-binding protein CbpA|nr:J domain-containing protein [Oscillospiraceae bacterium]